MKEILNANLPLRQVIIDRLEELDYTPESLREAITEHEADYRDENPSLYCGTYAKYNGGDLSGLWVDLSTFDSYEDFINFCRAYHADENDPELMFQDYENFPREWYCESCMGQETWDKIAEYIRLSEIHDKEAVDAFVEWGGESLDHFEDCYCGEWEDEEAFARHIVDECYDLDRTMGNLANYFDYAAYGRELFMYDYYMDNGYVFRHW